MPNKIEILIADDHQLFTEGITALTVQQADFSIKTVFKNGQELIDFLKSEQITADILLLDINMPIMNGIDCLEYLSLNNIPIKTIVLSMYEQPYLTQLAIEKGAKGFLLKNCSYAELKQAIDIVMQGDIYLYKHYAIEVGNHNGISFSNRESEVLQMVAKGLSSKQIAQKLFISFNTVESHRKNMMRKAQVNSTAGLIKYAFERKLIN